MIGHFPSPRFSIPLLARLNCFSSSSEVFLLSLIPFLLLSSPSIQGQYSSALPIPISFKNFTLSSLVFLLMVISFSIFSVDQLILKGSSLAVFSFSRERDRYDQLSLDGDFLFSDVFLRGSSDFLIVCYLTSKVTQPSNYATVILSLESTDTHTLGYS